MAFCFLPLFSGFSLFSFQSGDRGLSVLSGRALFAFDPTMFFDDAEAAEAKDFDSSSEANSNGEEKYDQEDQGAFELPQEVRTMRAERGTGCATINATFSY